MARSSPYVGRLAPSPTGFMHLGHARTFWIAQQRALAAGGHLLMRNDDLDPGRSRQEFVEAFIEDLSWLGLTWQNPILTQSNRLPIHQHALVQLHAAGHIYPCHRSRRDLAEATESAPHEHGFHDEPVFPVAWRPNASEIPETFEDHLDCNWRFRVPDSTTVGFLDGAVGAQSAVAGKDFGDFLVWRKNGLPSYQLTCAVDDGLMGITEVVRGADLIKSTFRQILLLRALELPCPDYYHAPLMLDAQGDRLAKRTDALSLRAMREQGKTPAEIISQFEGK